MKDASPRKRAPSSLAKARGARAELTRARIREVANDLFLKNGFESTTVDAIVAAAGVSKGAFYLHFERKEDLLLEYGAKRLALIRELLADLVTRETFAEALGEIVDTVIRKKSWDREVTGRAIVEMGTSAERLTPPPQKLLKPLVEIGQARGQVRDDIPAEVLSQFIVRSILGALRDWGLGTEELSRDDALNYALTLILDALAKRDPARGTGEPGRG
jgi:AcrR family transcriptional regulator